MSRTYHRRFRVTRTFCSVFVLVLCSLLSWLRRRRTPRRRSRWPASSSGCRPRRRSRRRSPRYRATYDDARARVKKLTGARKLELGGVVTRPRGHGGARRSSRPAGSRACSSRCSATSSAGRRSRCSAAATRVELHRLRARLPVLSRPRHPDPVARDVRQAQRLLERRQALRRQGRSAAGRDQAAGRRARRRPRVGVPVPVRRPAAAVGQLARPGHRPAGDGPHRHPPQPPGRRLADRARAGCGIFQTAPPAGVRIACRHRRALPAVLRAAEAEDPQRLHPVARRPLRLRRPHRRPDRASRCSRTATARAAPRCGTFDTGAWWLYAAARSPASPTSATTSSCATSSPAVHAHGRGRVLRRRSSTSPPI